MLVDATLLGAKDYILALFNSFPIYIALTSIVFFIGSANIAYMFMAISLILIVPAVVALLRVAVGAIGFPDWFVKIPATAQNPSYWLTSTVFIISYLFMNAYDLYNKEAPEKAPTHKVAARKSQAVIAMISILAIGLLLVGVRIYGAQESIAGVLVGVGAGIGVSYAIYNFMTSCGGLRIADLFGIAGRLEYKNNDGTICYPVK
jgi:hypothetical protein